MFILSANSVINVVASNSNYKLSDVYNIVNSIFPVGIFLVTTIYLILGIKNELVNENFNFGVSNKTKKTLYMLYITILLLACFIGWVCVCFIEYVFSINLSNVIPIISYIYILVLCIRTKSVLRKTNKAEKIINILIKNKKNINLNEMYILLIISGGMLGIILYKSSSGENLLKYLWLALCITFVTFTIVAFFSFQGNIANIKKVNLINKNDEEIAKGKIFKVVDDFIVLIKYNGDVEYINKSEIKKIIYNQYQYKNENNYVYSNYTLKKLEEFKDDLNKRKTYFEKQYNELLSRRRDLEMEINMLGSLNVNNYKGIIIEDYEKTLQEFRKIQDRKIEIYEIIEKVDKEIQDKKQKKIFIS
ncbi:hypothetical protein [Clostridium ganghwense]|uniref:Uncharacterized protein n=1 Tax=Clostridium ganghwense TaxID=312089 RepID=A0ABT4CTR7_9CLOT|nr:hypothetical protein [Clostridium ganghwense]MCY6372444.1 hypothetical protein [Clostridium ganghwense]